MAGRKLKLYINAESTRRVNSGNGEVTRPLTLHVGETVIFRVTLFKDDSSAYPVDTGSVYKMLIDDTHLVTHDPLVTILDEHFNVSGHWDEIDESNGRISARCSLTTTELNQAFTDERSRTMHLALWSLPPSGGWHVLGSFDVTMANPPGNPSSPSAAAGETFVTTDILSQYIEQRSDGTVLLKDINGNVVQSW